MVYWEKGVNNVNPCHAEYINILNGKQCRSRSVGFRSQLIWIYTVCKGRVYPGLTGHGLILYCLFSFQGVQDDIKTLQKNMDSINHLYRGLSLHIEPTFGKKLSEEVQELNTNWDKVLTLAEQQHARLKGSLDSSEEIYNKIGRIINWLGPIKDDLSNKDYAVESLNDLLVKNKKFKVPYLH